MTALVDWASRAMLVPEIWWEPEPKVKVLRPEPRLQLVRIRSQAKRAEDPEGSPEGKKEGKKKASGGGKGEGQESTILEDLDALAAFLDDPGSLAEAKKSENKGTGSAMGNKSGFIEGEIAQILAVIAVIGALVWGFVKGIFKKAFNAVRNKLRARQNAKCCLSPQRLSLKVNLRSTQLTKS